MITAYGAILLASPTRPRSTLPGARWLASVFGCILCSPAWAAAQQGEASSGSSSSNDVLAVAKVERFCSDCHAMPNPQSFEKDIWHEEVRKGFEFYARSGRNDLELPTIEEVVRYYRERAPEKILWNTSYQLDTKWLQRFEIDKLDWKDETYIPAGIASIRWVEDWGGVDRADGPKSGNGGRLLVTDCRDGSISLIAPVPGRSERTLLFRAQNPARLSVGDINQDGKKDVLVTDLGSLYPYDHGLGKVATLLGDSAIDRFKPALIAGNIGRVADVAIGDLGGSSMPDIAVAEFGHRDTGTLFLLKNVASQLGGMQYEKLVLDPRPGAVRVELHDWDGDGKLDITALMTQESESVEIYRRQGEQFLRTTVWTANDLSFGSVAMELVDLDQDGDMDILLCNGDSFDNNFANSTHGVRWLENVGELRFVHRPILSLLGAYAAKAGDIDRDGDNDIVVAANLPSAVKPERLRKMEHPSLVILENDGKHQFTPRVLSLEPPRRAALELADFNLDGHLDLAVGSLLFTPGEVAPRLTIWWQKP